jgi:hypothetical protein
MHFAGFFIDTNDFFSYNKAYIRGFVLSQLFKGAEK